MRILDEVVETYLAKAVADAIALGEAIGENYPGEGISLNLDLQSTVDVRSHAAAMGLESCEQAIRYRCECKSDAVASSNEKRVPEFAGQ